MNEGKNRRPDQRRSRDSGGEKEFVGRLVACLCGEPGAGAHRRSPILLPRRPAASAGAVEVSEPRKPSRQAAEKESDGELEKATEE